MGGRRRAVRERSRTPRGVFALVSPPAMARKSLRPHLNQIRSWVRQGRTDAWIAHQLEVPVQDISEFKRQNDLNGGEEAGTAAGHYPEEIDMRAADDALIAEELEAAARQAERLRAEEEELAKEAAAKKKAKKEKDEGEDTEEAEEDEEGAEGERSDRGRRRGRRGGRGRKAGRRAGSTLEGTFDHGEEGYGLWLDPAIQDDPVYAEHWAGHRPVEVTVEEEQIVIRRIREDS